MIKNDIKRDDEQYPEIGASEVKIADQDEQNKQ